MERKKPSLRIENHQILGRVDERKEVCIEFDGKRIPAYEGEPIAAALMAAGVRVFRFTQKRNDPRGVFCAIGRCTDCVMTVDDQPNIRTCVTPVKDGMKVETQRGHITWRKKV